MLETDLQQVVEGAHSEVAVQYGLTAEALNTLHDHASDYESFMAASVSALGRRGVLTRALEPKTREIMALLDQLDDLAPQFAATPGGAAFIERWQASARIIARGKSGKPSEPHGTPAGA